jgi:hypothetical protein
MVNSIIGLHGRRRELREGNAQNSGDEIKTSPLLSLLPVLVSTPCILFDTKY